AQNKMAGVIGHDDHAALEAIRLYLMNAQACLLTLGEELQCSETLKFLLSQCDITVYTQRVKTILEENGILTGLIFEHNTVQPFEVLFYPSVFRIPRSHLAQELGVHVDGAGFIQINERYETNIPQIYAIGDLTARG